LTGLFIAHRPKPHRNIEKSIHRHGAPVERFFFLKSDVAKIGWQKSENKKMASTAHFHKPL